MEEEVPLTSHSETLPLVSIGASAGGLEPLERFFENAPVAAGWCYVVVQHLSPDYRSMMDELLGRKSRLRIRHIEDGAALEPDTIFLNRPNTIAELDGEVFRTRDYQSGDALPHTPIDAFLNSVSSRDPKRTVAIILSGSGSDGARGADTLHRNGGVVLVQSPAEAAFASMPRSVLATGAVDRVMVASDMPSAIRDVFATGKLGAAGDASGNDTASAQILRLLEDQHHVDFSAYKPVNVQRRIERRQQLRGVPSTEEYLALLTDSPAALDELYQDLLIGVTQFYRDPDAIRLLRETAIATLVRKGDETTPLRIWVPGCASGEEAYTIGIEMTEALRETGQTRRFRIIATDVHRRSVDIASAGVYSDEALAKIPEPLRSRYFLKHRGQRIVDPALRQKIIFSVHDVLSDPPFMHLDLVSCRNMLIYLNDEPQARVISMFLFGLRRDGYLFLGPSESLGKYAGEFEVEDARWRLFRKASARTIIDRSMLTTPIRGAAQASTVPSADAGPPRVPMLREVTELRDRDLLIRGYDALLKRYAPSSILIGSDGRVLGWFGAASSVIDTMNNLADWTVEDIVHPDLHFPINVAMERQRQGQLEAYVRKVSLDRGHDRTQDCTVRIESLGRSAGGTLMLVTLDLHPDDAPRPTATAVEIAKDGGEDRSLLTVRIQELERDLRLTEETLQHVTERLESSGEELQASNEELQASNEELQASNEELQSANEELHAVNEELVSVSAEHERKITLLSDLNESTELVLRILGVGVIFLGPDGRIERYSALIAERFQLETHDIARRLSVIGPRVSFADLSAVAEQVTETGDQQMLSGDFEGRELFITVRGVPAARRKDTGTVLIFRGPAMG